MKHAIAPMDKTFYLQHDNGMREAVPAREAWKPQRRRGRVIACRFIIFYRGRWRRLYADTTPRLALPHFVMVSGERVAVSGVCP